jgi:hypothetical protein
MPLPASVSTGTVTGTWVGADGEPCTGCVIFTAAALTLRVAVDDTVVHLGRVIAELDADGSISQELVATDDADTDPTGFTWHVRVELDRGAGYTVGDIAVLGGETVDLTDA